MESTSKTRLLVVVLVVVARDEVVVVVLVVAVVVHLWQQRAAHVHQHTPQRQAPRCR